MAPISHHPIVRVDKSQCRDHVANAFYTAAAALQASSPGDLISGIALPRTSKHQKLVNDIEFALNELKIAVFWVDKEMQVTLACDTPLRIIR